MRYVWLVALREFAENAKTKGFWIGILLVPVMIYAGMRVPALLEEKVPTRFFVLADATQQFEPVVRAALDKDHAERTRTAYAEWTAGACKAGEAVVGTMDESLNKELGADLAKRTRDSLDRLAVTALLSAVQEGPGALPEINKPGMTQLKKLSAEEQERAYGVIGAWTRAAFEAGKARIAPFEEPRRRFAMVPPPADTDPSKLFMQSGVAGDGIQTNAGIESFRPYLTGQKKVEVGGANEPLFALMVIPEAARNVTDGQRFDGVEYWCTNLTDNDLKGVLRGALEESTKNRLFQARGVEPKDVKSIQAVSFRFDAKDPKKQAGKEKVSMEDTARQWAPVGAVYLLWIAIFSITQLLLNNTTEEKQSRVIEVLLSSVTPGELMFGKLLGIAAVGLATVTAWIGSFILVLNLTKSSGGGIVSALADALYTPELLVAFSGYFLLGYLLYAGVFLAMGAIVNTLKEAQNLMGPITLVMSVPLFTMIFIAKEPNGTLATVLSWIPLYTPFVMMNRAAASPPMFDVVGTLILLLVSVAVSIWLSGKIFRIGILRTGQPPRLTELLGWLRS